MNRQLYDWGSLFRRGRFRLWRGRDYHCSQASIAQQARNAASDARQSVTITEGEGFVDVEVKPRAKNRKQAATA